MLYKYRYLQDNLAARSPNFRCLLVTGPRRSGKSTFAKRLQDLWGGGSYVSFDTPIEQARFRADPIGYLSTLKTPAVLDEIQNVPDAFNYLKALVDREPHRSLDYILTGSQQFQMMAKVSESLSGRILVKELHPFSLGEWFDADSRRVKKNFEKILAQDPSIESISSTGDQRPPLAKILSVGGFPPAALIENEAERYEWFNSYFETYVQRDLRALSNIQDLSKFSRFVSLVAGRTAQVINHSELGKDLAINYKTSQHYLSLLESSFLWRALPPYFRAGSEKRLSRSPKGIFSDTGLAMFLGGLSPDSVERSDKYGALFESLVVAEFMKLSAAFGVRCSLCHFLVRNSAEVDLVLEIGERVVPIEIKCSATINPGWGRGIRVFREVVGVGPQGVGFVISLAPQVMEIAPGVWNVPLSVLY